MHVAGEVGHAAVIHTRRFGKLADQRRNAVHCLVVHQRANAGPVGPNPVELTLVLVASAPDVGATLYVYVPLASLSTSTTADEAEDAEQTANQSTEKQAIHDDSSY